MNVPAMKDQSNQIDSANTPPRYAHKGNLTEGSINRHLLRLGLPMMWGIFSIISFQLVDIYFVSLLGTKKLAALSFTLPITMIVFSIFLGLTISMASVLSRQIGEGNHDRVIRITTHGLILALLLGLIVAGIGFLTMNPVFRLLGATDEMIPLIRNYMGIWFMGSIFVTMPMIGNAALRATGNSFFPAIIMTTAALANVILDPIMIFGLFGFPRLELQGAAIATVIANACAMIAGFSMLYFKEKIICFKPLHLEKFGDSSKRLAFIAIPAGLMGAVQPLTNAVIIALLSVYGAETVAAYGVVTRVEAFAFIIIMGLAGGMAPIIGQNWGAKKFNRVNEVLHKAFRFNAVWSLCVAAVLGLFARQIAGIFSDDISVIENAALYFWIVPITYAAGNLIQGWSSAFNAMGMPKRGAIMIFSKYIAVQIPLVIIGSHLFGVAGIFGAIALANLGVGLVLHTLNWRLCRSKESAAQPIS